MCALHINQNALGFELYDGDRLVTLYRAREELPRTESPKPCFAPIYTPSGILITEYRPADHLWHTGLYFGWVHVNDANLWGGPWYLPESGKYEYVDQSHGVQRHDQFSELAGDQEKSSVTEKLTWLDQSDRPLVSEQRRYTFETLEDKVGYFWTVETIISPVVDRLSLGASKAARYSGLVLRMGPPFAAALHRSSEGHEGHEQIMGATARWVSAAGSAGGAVVMMDHPQNPRHPVPWFTRGHLLGAGLLMEGPMTLDRGEKLRLRYGLAILDEAQEDEAVESIYSRYIEIA